MTTEIPENTFAGEACVTPRHAPRYRNRHVCPVCKRPIASAAEGIAFPPLKARLFKLIADRPGQSLRELTDLIYARTDQNTLVRTRVHINQMREMLADASDVKIVSMRGSGYWLEYPNREPEVG